METRHRITGGRWFVHGSEIQTHIPDGKPAEKKVLSGKSSVNGVGTGKIFKHGFS